VRIEYAGGVHDEGAHFQMNTIGERIDASLAAQPA
jgi:hypothetical protein